MIDRCYNPRCSKFKIKHRTVTSEVRTDPIITLTSLPDGKEYLDRKVNDEFFDQNEVDCGTITCECPNNCQTNLSNCPKSHTCEWSVGRKKTGEIVDAKSGIIVSLPRARQKANYTWVI